MTSSEESTAAVLREVKTDRTKLIRFTGETEDGEPITWYTAYRGKFGWTAFRPDGEIEDSPDEDDIRDAFHVYDSAEVVRNSETPEGVA